MDVLNIISIVLFLVLGYFITRKDTRTGIIPNKLTHPLIFIGVLFNLIRYGFTLNFYKFFTILILLYFIFECIQRVLHLNNNELGTGDIKFFLAFYCLFQFSSTVIFNLPLVNIFGFVCIGIGAMVLFKIGYYTLLNRLPKFRLLMDSTMNKTNIRLAPLIYLSSILFFLVF